MIRAESALERRCEGKVRFSNICVIGRVYYPSIISGNKLRDVETRAGDRSMIPKYGTEA